MPPFPTISEEAWMEQVCEEGRKPLQRQREGSDLSSSSLVKGQLEGPTVQVGVE